MLDLWRVLEIGMELRNTILVYRLLTVLDWKASAGSESEAWLKASSLASATCRELGQ